MAESVKLDNVNITNVTRYGVLNAFNRCGSLNIYNSNIEEFDAPYANIYNTNLLYNESKSIYLENCNIYNSYIQLKNRTKEKLLKFIDTNLNSTLIESTEVTTGCIKFEGTECKMINCTLKNLRGSGARNSNSSDYGVLISSDAINEMVNLSNNYENCDIYVRGATSFEKTKFDDSYIYWSSVKEKTGTLTECVFNKGTLRTYGRLTINKCITSGTDHLLERTDGQSIRNIIDSTLEGTFSYMYFTVGSICSNSIITSQTELASNAFSNVKFSNGSKLILNSNTSSKPITNNLSTLGIDYTVKYMDN